ncbi:MAG: CBO0543 family protein [Sporolactobacillus sp.]
MWLVLPTIFIFALIIWRMPKTLSVPVYFMTSLMNIIVQLMTDIYLQFGFHSYGYFNPHYLDPRAWLFFFIIYPAVNVVFINFIDYRSGLLYKILYITGWSLFATGYEWVTLKAGAFYYIHWKLLYSAMIYPFLYIMLWTNLLIARKILSRQR